MLILVCGVDVCDCKFAAHNRAHNQARLFLNFSATQMIWVKSHSENGTSALEFNYGGIPWWIWIVEGVKE